MTLLKALVGAVALFLAMAAPTRAAPAATDAAPSTDTVASTRKVDFLPATDRLKELNLDPDLARESVKFEIRHENGIVGCQATVIADTYLLTAGHCLGICLADAGAFDVGTLLEVDHAKLTKLNCPVEINGQRVKARIVAMNSCASPMRLHDTSGKCTFLDYAVLKLDEPIGGTRCMPTADRLPELFADVGAMLYHQPTARATSGDPMAKDIADSQTQYMTTGVVTPATKTCLLKSSNGTRNLPFSTDQDVIDHTMAHVADGNLLQTSLDFIKHSRGAGVFALESGRLVGVATRFTEDSPNNTKQECTGAGFVSSIVAIKQDIKKNWPALALPKIFDCRRAKGDRTGIFLEPAPP